MSISESTSVTNLFHVKVAAALLLFVVDMLFGMVPVFITIRFERFARAVSWINCFCGGFLLGTTLLQVLFEADRALDVALGNFPSAFMMFAIGYVGVMFFEKWVHVVTTEYRSIYNGNADEHGAWVLRSRTDLVRGNNVAAYVLVMSCAVENFVSTFAVGTQVDMSNLWAMVVMLLSTEWIQMFMFVFQFQQCKRGIHSKQWQSELQQDRIMLADGDEELAEKHALSILRRRYDPERVRRAIKRDTIVNVIVIAAANSLGIFIGNIFSQLVFGGNQRIQNACAGLLLALVSGVFMHIATSQMITPEFETDTESERVLMAKGALIVLGIMFSSLLNVLLTLLIFK